MFLLENKAKSFIRLAIPRDICRISKMDRFICTTLYKVFFRCLLYYEANKNMPPGWRLTGSYEPFRSFLVSVSQIGLLISYLSL